MFFGRKQSLGHHNLICNLLCCREADITKERIEKMLKAGANVILTTKGIDDMALKVRPVFKSIGTPRMVLLCYLGRSSVQLNS